MGVAWRKQIELHYMGILDAGNIASAQIKYKEDDKLDPNLFIVYHSCTTQMKLIYRGLPVD